MASLWDWLSSRLGTSRGASVAVAAGESFELLFSPWAAAYPTAMAAASKTAATEPNRRTDLLICAPIVVTRCGGRRRRERMPHVIPLDPFVACGRLLPCHSPSARREDRPDDVACEAGPG